MDNVPFAKGGGLVQSTLIYTANLHFDLARWVMITLVSRKKLS